jgi:hypothetical protein
MFLSLLLILVEYVVPPSYYLLLLLAIYCDALSDATIFEPNNVKNSFVCVTIQHNFDIALQVSSPQGM